jgi:hypothetical protein
MAVVVAGQLRVVKNMTNCLWQSRLTGNKTPSSSIHSFCFFSSSLPSRTTCKAQCKGKNAHPRANVAYHRMNELEDDDLDEEDSAHENAELSENENNSDN